MPPSKTAICRMSLVALSSQLQAAGLDSHGETATIADAARALFSAEVRRKLGGRFAEAVAVFRSWSLFSAPLLANVCSAR